MKLFRLLGLVVLGALVLPGIDQAGELFTTTLGPVKVGDVKVDAKDSIDLPFLTWGGDVATFMANGGKDKTMPGSTFDKLGFKFNMVNGDDFVAQVKNYLEGKTPFLRGTIAQFGMASEVLGKDDRAKPVVFLQLTWSKGDHLVARSSCPTLNDLKGKTIALQKGGPHLGMLYDILKTTQLKLADVNLVWTDDVSGDKGPAEAFRKDAKIDACFAISPDMLALTTGLEKTGDGSEKSIKGAHVIDSTVYRDRSIADVYACRKDFYDKNQAMIEKLTGAYIAGCEQLVQLRTNYDKPAKDRGKKDLETYTAILKLCQDAFGKEAVPDDEAAHGLISDAYFVGLPGNVYFFKEKIDVTGFHGRMTDALRMADNFGLIKETLEPLASALDYDNVKNFGDLKIVKARPVAPPRPTGDVIYTFSIQYKEGQKNFPIKEYEEQFSRALRDSRLYGQAAIEIRGHADIAGTLLAFIKAGVQTKQLVRKMTDDGPRFYLTADNSELKLDNTAEVLRLIKKMNFAEADQDPKVYVSECEKLGKERAENVKEALLEYASSQQVVLRPERLKIVTVGVAAPVVRLPRLPEEMSKNRRVEFRILKVVSPEAVSKEDFGVY
jgi:ABC-type nitrate/sulfonate/bicarbonate transport system substrate-binding protein